MNDPVTVEGCDALLLPLLQARDPAAAELLLTQLIQEHADPIIARILKSKLRVSLNGTHGNQENQDALDLASELRATLIGEVRVLQQDPDRRAITSFRDYVAIKTYSACADYFRARNPRRARLRSLLRYRLKQNRQFALWKADDGGWYAGLESMRNDVAGPAPSFDAVHELFPTQLAREVPPADWLAAVFTRAGHPVEFNQVVALVAEFWDITDMPPESVDDPDYEPNREPIDASPGVGVLLEQRLFLEKLWTEVVQLPVLQRAALLLNLRDAQGASAIFFLPHLGIASIQQISWALEQSEQEFAALWNSLPLDDASIAQRMGITRQQVINLRKTARERLRRRMDKTKTSATANSKKLN